jgi:ADP-ribose pyrophosphatase YjhB (NUDIX family)
MDEPTSEAAQLHEMAIELVAMSQNGLNYATDRYDVARYGRLRAMGAELLAILAGSDSNEFHHALLAEAGHATPKVDVRAGLFDGSAVLLVQEARDSLWTMPGGWADALDSPSQAATREFAEEAGLQVVMSKLACVHDGTRRNAHHTGATGWPWHVYKLMFVADRCDDADPVAGLDGETLDVAFFDVDHLPPLSIGRTTAEQVGRLYQHHLDRAMPTEVD